MEHLQAISSWLTPVLLACIAWYLKRFFERNEAQHDKLFSRDGEHDSRLARLEARVDHVEDEIHEIRNEIVTEARRCYDRS